VMSLVNLQSVNRLLCLGAHADDIELGAGGMVMRLIAQNPGIHIRWVVMCGADHARAEEARRSAALFTAGAAAVELEIHQFKDAFLPWQGDRVKAVFEALKADFVPDLILTHTDQDRHQDHRLVSELSWNTWRDHTILEYEILKWDGDLGRPNVLVPLSRELSLRKTSQIYASYGSQHSRQWFSEETFLALMRVRGVECNADYAEGFYARKLVW
jgi:LmbE family N-acetylglucosaminyl deacetylase